MIDSITEHWNNLLTITTFFLALATSAAQIKHYRAQSPSLNIFEVYEAKYAPDPEQGVEGTRYDFKVKIGNSGRESTTVIGGLITIEDTEETIKLQRIEGSTEIPIGSDAPPNLPHSVDSEVRIVGNDVEELKYRAKGKPREDNSKSVNATLKLRTIGGKTDEYEAVFKPREHY